MMQNVNIIGKNTNETHIQTRQKLLNHYRVDRSALWVGLVASLIILPLVLFGGLVILFQVRQLNLPNIYIFDRHVGLISQNQTASLVDAVWNQDRWIRLTALEDPTLSFQFTPQELGLWVDPQATASDAYSIGRSTEPSKDLAASLSGQSQFIMPVLYLDESHARQTLTSLADTLQISPENASLAFQDGAWVALPGKAGRALDIMATLDNLVDNAFSILLTGSGTIHIKSVPPEVSDLSPLLDQIETLTGQEFRLAAYDPITDQSFEWVVPLEQKISWVAVEPHTQEISLVIRADDVDALFGAWASDLGNGHSFEPTIDGAAIIESWRQGETPLMTIIHDPTTYLVSPGESLWSISLRVGMPLWYIMDANPGLTVNNLSVGMTLTIPSKNILLPLPVVPNKRIVIDISEQRMTVYEDGQVRNSHIVSTGMADSPTMAGIFQVQSHILNAYASNWDLYMPHFLGIYEAWPGFMNGIHGLPLLSSGQRLWASNLGSPASYGCIILNLAAAEDLYYWADPGVVVEIRN